MGCLTETTLSRDGNRELLAPKASETRHYVIRDESDLSVMWAQVVAASPAAVLSPDGGVVMPRKKISYKPVAGRDDGLSNRWEWSVEYSEPTVGEEELDLGEYKISVSTTGGTQKILTSLQTVKKYPDPGAPNYQQAIQVSKDNDVAGCEIVMPVLKWTVHFRQPKAILTKAYVRTVASITGTTNNATFFGFAPDEVLFLGFDGEQSVGSDPVCNYHFQAAPHVYGKTIGYITGIDKKAWDYLWVLFEDVNEPAVNYTPRRPKAVYVERVYEQGNFLLLGIGT